MLSRRVPSLRDANDWTRALERRRALGAPLIDLTESNPTRTGLTPDPPLDADALRRFASGAYDPHPRGSREARDAIAAYYAGRGLAVDPGHLVLTSGTSESYAHLFRLLCDPGQSVAVPAPSYPLFAPIAAAEGVAIETYRLDPAEHFAPDESSLEAALDRGARAVIVVQPNHPTGRALAPAALASLDARCAARDVAIISDEVFGDHPWPPRAEPLPSLIGARAARCFVLHGLSKLCGLPQWKLGWIWAGGPEAGRVAALDGLEWLADLFLSVSGPVQALAPQLLLARGGFRIRVRERLAINLDALRDLCVRRPELSLLPAEGGWSAMLQLPSRHNDEAWALALIERGVVAHPGHFYDVEGLTCLVVSLIVEPSAFRGGLAAFDALLADA